MKNSKKRVFFGMEIHAPWPEKLPKGRLLQEQHRHTTLAFLGDTPLESLEKMVSSIPTPLIKIGQAGYFDACLFLPPKHPHVVSWHVQWLNPENPIIFYQNELSKWLKEKNLISDEREWTPHVTLCRQPFNPPEWKKNFSPIPLFASSIHLYESLGSSIYQPIWTHSILPPFEELDHTADIAFKIRGENFLRLYHNAFLALSFKYPFFLSFFLKEPLLNSLDDIIILLNQIIGNIDREIGCPLKAVSFHGEIVEKENLQLEWEMIVDV